MKSDLTFWDHPNWTGKGNYVNPPESLEPKRAAHSFASRAMTRLQSQGFWCQSVQLLSGSEQSKAASRTDGPIVGRRSDGFGRDALAAEPMVRPKKCGKNVLPIWAKRRQLSAWSSVSHVLITLFKTLDTCKTFPGQASLKDSRNWSKDLAWMSQAI